MRPRLRDSVYVLRVPEVLKSNGKAPGACLGDMGLLGLAGLANSVSWRIRFSSDRKSGVFFLVWV